MSNSWQHIRALWKAAGERPYPSRDVIRVLRRHFAEPGIVRRMAMFETFMNEAGRAPHEWGKSDCSLVLADWTQAIGFPDCADDLRGTYGNEDECRALLASRGGLVAVVDACARRIGLTQIFEPEFGAVAVIGSPHREDRQWGAIWNGQRWLVRWVSFDGKPTWAAMQASPIKMWRV